MAHFHIRYANNEGRFKACKPVDEIIISDEKPTAFPQNTEIVPQSEDSFFLEIWTPETSGTKPVLFWIHGGAFEKSSPCRPTNDASNLATNTDIIVVSCAYRLGMLGMLNYQGIEQQNCGLHDIITALEWTKQNINKFGGDSDNITIGGQSSGAWYAMAIHTSPITQSLFDRTMLFSFPGDFRPINTQTATEISHRFFNEINTAPQEIDKIDIKRIIATQIKIGKKNKKKYRFDVPMLPSVENGYVAKDFFVELPKIDKPIFVQYTSNECGLYVNKYPIIKYLPPILLIPRLKRYYKQNTLKEIRESYKQTRNSYQTVLNLTTKAIFQEPAKRIKAIVGDNCHLQKFDIPTTNPLIQCCHGIDRPFIFSNFEAWIDNPIFNVPESLPIHEIAENLQEQIREFCYEE